MAFYAVAVAEGCANNKGEPDISKVLHPACKDLYCSMLSKCPAVTGANAKPPLAGPTLEEWNQIRSGILEKNPCGDAGETEVPSVTSVVTIKNVDFDELSANEAA